jgi:hypothetical protein
VASPKATVKVAANFESNLASIGTFWSDRKAPYAFMQLLEDLETVIGNLERYPLLGRSFLNRSPQSLESVERLSKLKHRLGDIDVREYLFGDYIILYGVHGSSENLLIVHLLAVRHHRQLSFDFEAFWRSNRGARI